MSDQKLSDNNELCPLALDGSYTSLGRSGFNIPHAYFCLSPDIFHSGQRHFHSPLKAFLKIQKGLFIRSSSCIYCYSMLTLNQVQFCIPNSFSLALISYFSNIECTWYVPCLCFHPVALTQLWLLIFFHLLHKNSHIALLLYHSGDREQVNGISGGGSAGRSLMHAGCCRGGWTTCSYYLVNDHFALMCFCICLCKCWLCVQLIPHSGR